MVAVEKCAGRDRHAASGEPNERIDVVVGQVSPDVVWKSRERHEVAARAPYPVEPGERSGNVGDDERIRRKTSSDREQRRRDVRNVWRGRAAGKGRTQLQEERRRPQQTRPHGPTTEEVLEAERAEQQQQRQNGKQQA